MKNAPKKLFTAKPEDNPPRKRTRTKYLIKMMLAYSARNNRANPPLEYSMLNPETNSDSPSAKSKGVRLVSASIEVPQQKKTGTKKKINQIVI
jgi:hypothetical protein